MCDASAIETGIAEAAMQQ